MSASTVGQATASERRVTVAELVGSGHEIGRAVLPVIVIGLGLNVWRPELFSVGGPPQALEAVSWAVLAVGVTTWLWSVVLILAKVPRHELITTGPFRLMKHPLYTGVSLLVLPWAGFLLDSWLGVVLGVAVYAASRRYAPSEERSLAEAFGANWDAYAESVSFPWL